MFTLRHNLLCSFVASVNCANIAYYLCTTAYECAEKLILGFRYKRVLNYLRFFHSIVATKAVV